MDLLNYVAQKPFSQKHLLKIQDYSTDEILQVLSLALKIKKSQKSGDKKYSTVCQDKILAMIFSKPSTRTRVSFEVGIRQLGGSPMFLSGVDLQLGKSETIEDTAKVLSRMVDAIMIRTFLQSDVEALAKHGSIPIINGLTDDVHPCQAFADMLTYFEHKKKLSGKLTYIGDGNNVANSLMIICSKLGIDFSIGCPKGYEPAQSWVELAKHNASQSGSKIEVLNDIALAAKDADCLYTDVITSMGQEAEKEKRLNDFKGVQINETLAKNAKPDYIFMHCLPAHRNEEVSPEIIDGAHSVVFDEAENRLHAQKAVLALLLG